MPRATTASKSREAGAKKAAAASTEFTVYAPEAREVQLVGDFNDWNGADYKMRRFKDGTWKKKVKLQPGRYEYRFVVDGDWWTDPENPDRQPNAYGSENSVATISG
ncbi:MAG: isoamylase early set domain-containing protein [Desulfobacteraceae bacterium]|nr:isoamylase early set domain-containing protein [Desulfobacteraceae bacterium]